MTAFADDDFLIGRRVFEELGEENGFAVRRAPAGAGVLACFDDLAGDGFVPGGAHPLVRSLYEATSAMCFVDRRIDFDRMGRVLHGLFRALVSKGMQQLAVPDAATLPRAMSASVLLLDTDGDGAPDYRVWVRTFDDEDDDEENDEVFYVGTVATHRSDDGARAYLSVCLPLYRANITFVFQPFAHEGDGLRLSTRGSPGSDAGVYVVFPGRERYSLVRVPLLVDEIAVRVAGDGLEVTHRSRSPLGGFDMHYEIREEDVPA